MNAIFLSKQIKRVLAGTARINKNDRDVLIEVADELEVIAASKYDLVHFAEYIREITLGRGSLNYLELKSSIEQWKKEAGIKAMTEFIFCGHGLDNKKHGCGDKRPIYEMFRCYFCLTYYCEECSKKHYGSREEHNIENEIEKYEFLRGVLYSVQELITSFDEPTMAGHIMRESGYDKKQFLEEQKLTNYESRRMNKIIREEFK